MPAEGLLKPRSQSACKSETALKEYFYYLTACNMDNIKLKVTERIYMEFYIVKSNCPLLILVINQLNAQNLVL